MNIYKVHEDVKNYQTICPTDESIYDTDILEFNCLSKINAWTKSDFFVFNPKSKKSDFPHLIPGCLVVSEHAANYVGDLLEMAGELLPIRVDKEQYYILNILECLSALNEELTEWSYFQGTQTKNEITKYNFYTNRFSESSIFKIPQSATSIFALNGYKEPADEFYTIYRKSKLTGLIFEEIYSF